MDPALVTMDPAIMEPATIGGQVWGSMSDLVGVIGISLRSFDRSSAVRLRSTSVSRDIATLEPLLVSSDLLAHQFSY